MKSSKTTAAKTAKTGKRAGGKAAGAGSAKSAAGKNTAQPIALTDPSLYVNRELSWLAFNRRVLDEAKRKDAPLFERIKFLSITSSNLDEFFMVRVASLKDMIQADYAGRDLAGMTAAQQLEKVLEETHAFVADQYRLLNRTLIPQLAEAAKVRFLTYDALSEEQRSYLDRYYEEEIYPVLTPMAIDSSRPFPLIVGRTLNLGALLRPRSADGSSLFKVKKKGKKADLEFATVQVPSGLPRLIALPSEEGTDIILLEEVIRAHMDGLFVNFDVICSVPYRLMRNADLTIDEDEAEDLLLEIEKQVRRRQWGEAIRLEVEKGMDPRLLELLTRELSVKETDLFEIDGPLDLTFLMKLYGRAGFDEFKEHRYPSPHPIPGLSDAEDIFQVIRSGDVFLHHPYQQFDPVVRFIAQAAVDPEVLAIKQTLYRVSGNSPIIAALARAAENGKQVSVLVELKARFDEENNIVWARMLEKAGCHVIYGLVGLKTHSKITLVVRREEDGIRRYVHLGTGNYNDSTAKLYTDIGLLSCREDLGEDATSVFNMLSGYSEPRSWNALSLAPLWLKDRLLYLIHREAEHARAGEDARIIAKMNSLCEPRVIQALYEASQAGVKIDLIVRGICSLRPGIPGVSENITVRSIVGNFLEHSRIFYFEDAGMPEIYGASADWMPRNLDRRVEIMFPLEDEKIAAKAKHILDVELMDTEQAQIMQPDGSYERVDRRGKTPLNSQLVFGEEAASAHKEETGHARVFTPKMSPHEEA